MQTSRPPWALLERFRRASPAPVRMQAVQHCGRYQCAVGRRGRHRCRCCRCSGCFEDAVVVVGKGANSGGEATSIVPGATPLLPQPQRTLQPQPHARGMGIALLATRNLLRFLHRCRQRTPHRRRLRTAHLLCVFARCWLRRDCGCGCLPMGLGWWCRRVSLFGRRHGVYCRCRRLA